jgi:SAM-dependent methyltransferase
MKMQELAGKEEVALPPRTTRALARQRVVTLLKSRGKLAFLRSLPPGAQVLDVGCGNNSPREAKTLRPDLVYTGLDVGDYNQQDSIAFADRYLIVPPDQFAAAIAGFAGRMDAVVSAHNLEHCDAPAAVLEAMLRALKPGGRLYLSFPSEASAHFPHRHGCLNFRDDSSHQQLPRWDEVTTAIEAAGCRLEFARARYRPPLLAAAGLLLEPVGALTRRNMPAGSTWALYGFESVLWVSAPP